MTAPHFLVESDALRKASDSFTLEGTEARHLARVLRLGPGREVVLVDGAGSMARCRILTPGKLRSRLEILEKKDIPDDRLPVDLYCALIKAERMEWLVQKAVELGTRSIQPLISMHGVVRPDMERMAKLFRRIEEIAGQALKQCKGFHATRIRRAVPFVDGLPGAGGTDARFVLSERGGGIPHLAQAWSKGGRAAGVAILAGPEGGLSPEEEAMAVSRGFAPVTLGRRILRAETACIAAISVISGAMNLHGELNT